MGAPHRAVCRVHRLTARSARAENIDAQVPLVDADIDVLRLGEHGDCCGRGVDTTSRLGFWDAVDAGDPRLKFEVGESVPTADQGSRFFKSAEAGFGKIENLEAPPSQCGVPLVHAKELRCEQCRLVAPGTRADLEYRVSLVVGILRKQRQLYLLL